MNFNLVDFLKLPSNVMSAISLASGLILFLPDELLKKMYMIEFKNKWGFIIGATFIVSTSILAIGILRNIYKFFHKKYLNFKFKKHSNKIINSLDMYKKMIVYILYTKDNNTVELPLNDGAVVFLEHSMVIQKATRQHAVDDISNPKFPYFLQPWVVKKLNKDEDLLLEFKKAAEQQLAKLRGNNQFI